MTEPGLEQAIRKERGLSELFERAVGSAGAVCVFGLFAIWTVDVDIAYKLSATFLSGAAVLGIALLILLKRRRLQRVRQEQLRQFRDKILAE